jgi:protein-S-isoprenylcysteine O-methyltransferase Ste14
MTTTTTIIGIVVLVGALCVFLLMAKAAVRWAIRLALLGIVILALVIGSVAWWWYGAGDATTAPQREARPAGTRRANSR